ncbi:helix-turn-helix transcriptional regulator [Micromonospora echinospora]|uniref:helix-turn-helix domain-containing protein n=1 Tax=Micromonospora echinospora TaxID=1877 RepID=UPI0033DB095C
MGISPSEFLLRELRRRRVAAGLTQDALGERVHYSNTHVSAIETGVKPPKPEYLKAVDEALETGGILLSLWEDLVKDAGTPVWLREWIEYEREAVVLRWYEPAYVPGLLQTEAYARAALSNGWLSAEEVDQRVESRMGRQSCLARSPVPQLFMVLDEMVIRRTCGSTKIMAEQVDHLIGLAEQPNVQVHVVPLSAGLYPALAGGFIVADLPDSGRAGYIDNQLSGQVVDRPDDVARLALAWDALRGEALPGRQSLDLLREVAKTWT